MQCQTAGAIALQGHVGIAFVARSVLRSFGIPSTAVGLFKIVHTQLLATALHGAAMEDNVFEMKLRIQQLEEKLAYLAGGTNGDELASIIMEKDEEIAKMVRYMQQCCRCHTGFTGLQALTQFSKKKTQTQHLQADTLRQYEKQNQHLSDAGKKLDAKVSAHCSFVIVIASQHLLMRLLLRILLQCLPISCEK
jgi:hypothetical protein